MLNFPEAERKVHEHELSLIYHDDRCRSQAMLEQSRAVLSISGNVGLFSMIARHHFPQVIIHCYEPNPALV